MAQRAAVSVDLDEVGCYTAIHGLNAPTGTASTAIYDRALPRLVELFASHGIRATFFAIGRDLARPENVRALRALADAGHEIANHTQQHRYDFTRQSTDAIREDIRAGSDAIAQAVGKAPVGFRAPGYTITDEVLAILEEQGYRYDSSVFPCPAYFGAKAAAMAAIALRGRTSRSVLDDPRVLAAPTAPYRVGTPYYRRGGGLLEIPIGVTPARSGRLPFIGTSLVMGGTSVARFLTRRMVGRDMVNLELHGIDLADAENDGLAFLRPHQPDLRRPVEDKRNALEATFRILGDAGYAFATLEEVADHLQDRASSRAHETLAGSRTVA